MASPIPSSALQEVWLINGCLKESFLHSYYVYMCVYTQAHKNDLFSNYKNIPHFIY